MFTTDKLQPLTFKMLIEYMGNKKKKYICHNTRAVKYEYITKSGSTRQYVEIELHGNSILRYYDNGRILASLAGYPTMLTRHRLNSLTRVYFWPDRGVTYFGTSFYYEKNHKDSKPMGEYTWYDITRYNKVGKDKHVYSTGRVAYPPSSYWR